MSRKVPVVCVRGSATATQIKGVPRPKTLAVFVGRLDMETKEEDLATMLSDANVNVVKCTKLKSKPGSK